MTFDTARNRWYAFIVLIMVQTFNVGVDLYSYLDRSRLHVEMQLSRKMLDARAKVQTTVVCHHWEKFSDEEKRVILEAWRSAEYNAEPCK